MPEQRAITLIPPTRGLYRGRSYAAKPLDTSELLLNVRTFDPIEDRERMGSRPGLRKAFGLRLGRNNATEDGTSSGTTFDSDVSIFGPGYVGKVITFNESPFRTYTISAVVTARRVTLTSAFNASDLNGSFTVNVSTIINMLAAVRTLNTSGFAVFGDELDSNANWDAASWAAQTATFTGGQAVGPTTAVLWGNVLKSGSVPDVEQEATRTVSVYIPSPGVAVSQVYHLYANMNNSSPVNSDSVEARLTFGGGSAGLVAVFVDDSSVASITPVLPTESGWFSLEIDVDYIRATWKPDSGNGPYEASKSQSLGTVAGDCFGFGLELNTVIATFPRINSFKVEYTLDGGGFPQEFVVSAANADFYRETPEGSLAKLTGSSVDLASDVRIYSAPSLQKLIIADYGIRHQRKVKHDNADIDSTGGVAAVTAVLTDSDAPDWTTLNINKATDVLELLDMTNTAGSLVVASYPITDATHATNLTFAVNPSARYTTSHTAYRILRYPKVYNSEDDTLVLHSTGTVELDSDGPVSVAPAGCKSVTNWANRIVWCNNEISPHVWWMSASGYPFVYDYGDTGAVDEDGGTTGTLISALGVAAAVNGTQQEFAGRLGEPIVTTIPITDDLLIFACKTSFYLLRGNPREGGRINNITGSVGIVGIGAWCRSSEGRLFVLTQDGLYEITAASAIPLSRQLIPKELLGLTEERYETSLTYDVTARAVRIAVTDKETPSNSVHYVYDDRKGGFLPDEYVSDHDPTSAASYQPGGSGTPRALWGSRDGYVRRHDATIEDDDGTNFDTRARYGPLLLGGSAYRSGVLHEIVCVLDVQSGDVTLEVRMGDSAQEASLASARYTTTMVAGRNYNRYPRLSGGTAYLDIVGTPGSRWAIESLTVTRELRGKLRTT